jgi:hypothetical protein
VDSPAWHLVQALATLVSPDGNDPAIAHFADKARPLSPEEQARNRRGGPSFGRDRREAAARRRALGA